MTNDKIFQKMKRAPKQELVDIVDSQFFVQHGSGRATTNELALLFAANDAARRKFLREELNDAVVISDDLIKRLKDNFDFSSLDR